MFWVNLMKILYRREMYRNQKTSRQYRQVDEIVHLCQTNLQIVYPTFHEHAWYWSPENENWNSRKPNRTYHFSMELGKKLTKPSNIMRRPCNPIGFKLHVRKAIESMGFSVASDLKCSSSSTRRSNEKRKRGRCFRCSRKDDRKVTGTFCPKCKRFICKQHRVTITTVACVRDCEGGRDWSVWWWAWWQWIQKSFCKICSQYIDLTLIKCSNENQMGKKFSLRYINTKTSVLVSVAKTWYFDWPCCAVEALYDSTLIINEHRRF